MLKIERDKVYIDGRGQRLLAVYTERGPDSYPFTVICVDEAGTIRSFTPEGRHRLAGTSERDLVREVKEKQVRYVNIYPNGTVFDHKSKRDAENGAGTGRLACIRVEYKEGQFDD
jgi:hypothetical protein